jgi:anaerobic ribonucleoside-triphosphate reductase
MFYCERCGMSVNAAVSGTPTACPRCRAKDGVYSPLTFALFDRKVVKFRQDEKGGARTDAPESTVGHDA